MTFRILMTGMSPPQCARKTRTGYEHISDLWRKALIAGGCEVHHDRINANLPLEDYDLCLIGLIPPNSIAARYMFPAFDVISRASRDPNGPAMMFYVDDWRFDAIMGGVRTFNRNPRRFITTPMFSQLWEREWAAEDGWSRVQDGASLLLENWPTTIIPAYNWGNHDLLPNLPTRKKVVLDPSGYAKQYDIQKVESFARLPTWIMGSFSDQRHWIDQLGAKWDIEYFGTRRSKSERGSMKEWDLVQRYGEVWGVLGAPYRHSGSGWWRNRFLYAAQAGAIMVADPAEVAGLQDYHLSVRAVESMSRRDRVLHAYNQAELMLNSITPPEVLTTQLMDLVRSEINNRKVDAA